MSANTQIARDFIDRGWNQRDESVIDDYVAPNHVARGPMTDDFQGREGQRNFLHTFLSAFNPLKADIKSVRENGDRITVDVLYTGKNSGSFMGNRATNKSVTVPVTITLRIQNGMITESQAQWDPNSMTTQMYGENVG